MIDDGGSAFPLQLPAASREGFGMDGMSLRDYFAAKALQALIMTSPANKLEPNTEIKILAAGAYTIADAMLKARK